MHEKYAAGISSWQSKGHGPPEGSDIRAPSWLNLEHLKGQVLGITFGCVCVAGRDGLDSGPVGAHHRNQESFCRLRNVAVEDGVRILLCMAYYHSLVPCRPLDL